MTATRRGVTGSLFELVLVVAGALVLALGIEAFLVKPYQIPSGSMLPTLHIDQRVLVDRIATHFTSPHLGDIIVFHPPKYFDEGCADSAEGQSQQSGQDSPQPCGVAQADPSSETFIKRVVGMPGDRISIRDGHVIRNGVAEHDPYIVPCGGAGSCNFPGTITVPKNDYYVLGDNRPDSEDSRFWGPVPRSWIIGKAFFTYWPPGRIGFL